MQATLCKVLTCRRRSPPAGDKAWKHYYLTYEVNDANDQAVGVAVQANKQGVVHDSQASQESCVAPQHSFQIGMSSLVNLQGMAEMQSLPTSRKKARNL